MKLNKEKFIISLLKNIPDVQIRSVDLSQELQILSYYLDRPVLKAVD